MSEDKITEFETKLSILDKVVKLGYVLIAGAFCMGIWVATLEFRIRDVEPLKVNMHEVILWKTAAQESRYTVTDHQKYAALVQEILNNQDKRLQRLEDTSIAIQKSLDRIESKLGVDKSP